MDLTNLINCMGTLFLLMATGFFSNKVGLLRAEKNRILSRVIMNVSMSAMIVDTIANTEISLSGDSAKEMILAVAIFYTVLIILGTVVGALLSPDKRERGIYQFMIMFGNVGFLGYPLIEALFGEQALFHAAMFNIPFNIIAYTYGAMLIRGGKGKASWKSLVSPPLVSSLVGLLLLFGDIHMPVFLADACSYLGAMTIPGAMLVVGSSLADVPGKSLWKEWRLYVLSFVVLMVRPALLMLILRPIIHDPLILGVGVMLAAVPAAANTTVMSIEYHSNEALASSGVFITTVLSLFTIPLMGMLLF